MPFTCIRSYTRLLYVTQSKRNQLTRAVEEKSDRLHRPLTAQPAAVSPPHRAWRDTRAAPGLVVRHVVGALDTDPRIGAQGRKRPLTLELPGDALLDSKYSVVLTTGIDSIFSLFFT